MNVPIKFQTINGIDGKPAFVVLPYSDFLRKYQSDDNFFPNEVVGKMIIDEMSPIRAWREYLGITQKQLADKLGISQAAVAQFENINTKVRKASRKNIATALGISETLLEV